MKQGQNQIKTKLINKARDQSGQAVVEYVLLLIVVVTMIMAAKGLFSGVNTFIGDYVGKYFSCLMDHGELPQLNVSSSDLKQHSTSSYHCTAKFSIANGATLTGSASDNSGGGGKDRANKAGLNANPNSASKDAETNSKDNRNGRRGDDDSSSGGSSRATARNQKSNFRGGTADGPNDIGSNKEKVLEEDDSSGGYAKRDQSRRGGTEYRYNKQKVIVSGQIFDEVQKKNLAGQSKKSTKSKVLPTEEGFRPGPRKNAFIPPERKPAVENTDTDPDFGLGQWIKWLMIAGMVVAIIIFFGGQILNYSNSE